MLNIVPPPLIYLSSSASGGSNASTPSYFLEEEPHLVLRKARLTDLQMQSRLTGYPCFAQLTLIDLSFNNLTEFPCTLSYLPNLHSLNLSSNRFTTFPLALSDFTTLTSLNLSRNFLHGEFPEMYCQRLVRLRHLRLSENQITKLPSNFFRLQALESLNLGASTGGNLLEEFPERTLSRLPRLRFLELNNNRLHSLPQDLGSVHSALEHLGCSNNRLTSLPRSIGQCQALRLLDLSRNLISYLPIELVDLEHLQSLDLSNNALCVIPADLINYMQRTALSLTGNPMMMAPSTTSTIGDFSPLPSPSMVTHHNQLEKKLLALQLDDANPSSPSTPMSRCRSYSSLISDDDAAEPWVADPMQGERGDHHHHGGAMAPSLKELAARAVLANNIKLPLPEHHIPRPIRRTLQPGGRPCNFCRQPYVSEFVQRVELRTCRGHPNLPTSVAYCSSHCATLSQPNSPTVMSPGGPFNRCLSPAFGSAAGPCSPSLDGTLSPRNWKFMPTTTAASSLSSSYPSPPKKLHRSCLAPPSPVVPVTNLDMVDSLNDW